MFDLLERTGAALDAVPVPLPGRVVMFAGPGGVPMVRAASGAVRDFAGPPGLPGVGFKLAGKLPAGALGVGAGLQVLASCAFAGGVLASGDVVEMDAPVFVFTNGVRMNVSARMDGGAWAPLFTNLKMAPAAGVRVSGVVIGPELRIVARCAAATVGAQAGAATPGTGEGAGQEVLAVGRLAMGAVPTLELAIEWVGAVMPAAGTVETAPITVRVS